MRLRLACLVVEEGFKLLSDRGNSGGVGESHKEEFYTQKRHQKTLSRWIRPILYLIKCGFNESTDGKFCNFCFSKPAKMKFLIFILFSDFYILSDIRKAQLVFTR